MTDDSVWYDVSELLPITGIPQVNWSMVNEYFTLTTDDDRRCFWMAFIYWINPIFEKQRRYWAYTLDVDKTEIRVNSSGFLLLPPNLSFLTQLRHIANLTKTNDKDTVGSFLPSKFPIVRSRFVPISLYITLILSMIGIYFLAYRRNGRASVAVNVTKKTR